MTTSCGLISGEMIRSALKADLGSTNPGGGSPTPTPTPSSGSFKLSQYRPDTSNGSTVKRMAIDSQGRKIYAGTFASAVDYARGLISFKMDGTRNTGFNEGLGAFDTNGSMSLRKAIWQSDGKLLVVGRFTQMAGVSVNSIMRLNADGTPDTSFVITGSGFNSSYIYDVAVQSDGKILVAGDFTSYNGTAIQKVARLNSDGSLDGSFSVGSGPSAGKYVYSVAIQADGKILVGGDFVSFNAAANTSKLARLETTGTVDTAFNLQSGFDNTVNQVKVLSDGKILVAGRFSNFNSGANTQALVRLNADGSRDAGFNSPGFLAFGEVSSFDLQSDGKIVIGGNFTGATHHCVARLGSDGTPDATMDTGTTWDCNNWDTVLGITVHTNGQIVVSGQKYLPNWDTVGVLVHNPDGSLDATFPANLVNGGYYVYATLNGPNNTFLVLGDFNWMGAVSAGHIYRETAAGAMDSGFALGAGFDGDVNALVVLADDSMIVGGNFFSYDSASVVRLAKLHADGSLDATFNNGSGFSGGPVLDVALQSDGKILVAGNFTDYNGTAVNRLVRLNADGTLDASFDVNTQLNNSVSRIRLQSDGKILISGAFTSYKGSSRNHLARLQADGQLDADANFAVGTGFNADVNDMVIQADGKIVAVGGFSTYQGQASKGIVRLSADGSLDTSFVVGGGFNGAVALAVALQSDGKVVVGGWMSQYDGVASNYLVRINSDGSRDATFNVGAGFDNPVTAILNLAGNVLVVGGDFFTYQGQKAPSLILLNTDGSPY